ncbi:MAG: methyltransferase, partial [Mesorhizobium sp.]
MNSVDLHMASNRKALRPAACPCCSAPVSRSIYRVESIPVHSCVLLNS